MRKIVFGFVKEHPFMVLLVFLASLGLSAVYFLLAMVLDYAVSSFAESWDYLAFLILLGFILLFFFFYWANRASEAYLTGKTTDYVRRRYLDHLFCPNRLLNGDVGGELNDVLGNASEAASAYLLTPISLTSETIGLLAAAIYGGLIHYGLTIVGLSIGALQLLSTFIFQARLGQTGEKLNQASASLREESERLLLSKGELQANRAVGFAKERFLSKAENAQRSSLSYHRWGVAQSVVSTFLSTVGELLCIGLLGYLIIRGQADLGSLAAAILILPLISDPVTAIASDLGVIFSAAQISIMKADLSLDKGPESPIAEFQGVEVCIDRVEGGAPRLSAKLAVKPKEKILVLGDSGSGKTTLLRYLSGETETKAGEVNYLNGIPASLSYCPQFPYCFIGSVPENIAFDDIESKRVAGISDSLGLSNEISDPRSASGGEKKLIGLARAFYPESGLLLLDEPASSLGKQEEKRVYEAILSYPWAVICSAHKPSLDVAGRFDRVYLIDQGKLFEATREQYARYCVD